MIVLDRDITAAPTDEIDGTKVDLTMVDGNIVYERDGAGV
jgi:predicted amidohydrolase YtcJ